MARAHFYRPLLDSEGRPLTDATVRILQPGTTVPILATLWPSVTGGSAISQPFAPAGGIVDFYLDVPQTVRLGVSRTGQPEVFIENLDVGTLSVAHAVTHSAGQGDAVTIAESQVTNLVADLGGKAPFTHAHAEADVTSLTTDLAGKAPTAHNHVKANVTDFGHQVSHASGQPDAITIAESQVTNLVGDLGNKAPIVHTHTLGDISGGTVDVSTLGTNPQAGRHPIANGTTGPATWVALTVKEPVTVATTANLNYPFNGLFAIDGVTLLAGNRVLVKNQTVVSQNGIYVAVAGTWSRSTDCNTTPLCTGAIVTVLSGPVNGGVTYSTSFKWLDQVGVTAMNWSRVVDSTYGSTIFAPVPTGTKDGTKFYRDDNTWALPTGLVPQAHASTHTVGGQDPVTLAESQITNLVTDLNGKALLTHTHYATDTANGIFDVNRLGSSPDQNKFLATSLNPPYTTGFARWVVPTQQSLNTPYKDWVRATTTGNLSSLSGSQVIDGVSCGTGDRVLVKDQATASQNGVYVVANGAWTRAADFNDTNEISAAQVPVQQGTMFSGTTWIVTGWHTNTLDVTALNFQPLTGIPTGSVQMFAGVSPPPGWVFCDGTSHSTTDPVYARLFSAIQYAWGGSGTVFNLPDFTDMFPVGRSNSKGLGANGGSASVTLAPGNLPLHRHTTPDHQHPYDVSNTVGVTNTTVVRGTGTVALSGLTGMYNPNASGGGNTGDGGFANTAVNIQNPWSAVNFIVKL